METKKDVTAIPEENKKKFGPAWAEFMPAITTTNTNPWVSTDVDKLEFSITDNEEDNFKNTIKAARFFYKKDPLASSIINKLIDIGITDLTFTQGTLSANEIKVFYALGDSLQEFAENLALEYLISGLVVPEINYERVNKTKLQEMGIKKYETLNLPTSMWLQDPAAIIIKGGLWLNEPSYFIKIPDNMIQFIRNEGNYGNGKVDKELYTEILIKYPDFVLAIKSGKTEIPLENDLIFRRRYLSNSPYPVPFLTPAIELLKHKRNLRRMDYSVAARVISAVQLIKLGNDLFPVTEEDQEQFDSIKSQMTWRYSSGRDTERVYQLFGNHTLDISWVFPPVESMLNDAKYSNVNLDIFYSLGFPKVLVVGEAERSNAGTAEYVSLSPLKTMEAMRRKILVVLQNIVNSVSDSNSFRYTPTVGFKPLRLESFAAYSNGLYQLYTTGNLSRTSYAEFFNYNLEDELKQKSEENMMMKDLNIEEFAPQPFSPKPSNNQQNTTKTTQNQNQSE